MYALAPLGAQGIPAATAEGKPVATCGAGDRQQQADHAGRAGATQGGLTARDTEKLDLDNLEAWLEDEPVDRNPSPWAGGSSWSSLRRKRSAAARKGALALREARAAAAYRSPSEAWGLAWVTPWADGLPPDS
jgi:hypothetical protein